MDKINTEFNTSKNKQKKPSPYIRQLLIGIGSIALFFLGYLTHDIQGKESNKFVNADVVGFGDSDENAKNSNQNTPDMDFEAFWEVWNYVKNNYVDSEKVSDEKLYYGALEGIVGAVDDPYSVFFEPVSSEQFQDEISGNLEGIGAEIGIRNNELTIISPIPGSPAEKFGLKGGDIILAIDGKDTLDLPLGQAVYLIRGQKGTTVTLTVFHPGDDGKKDVIIVRDKISINSVEWTMVGNVAHMKLKYFNEDTLEDFKVAVHDIILKNPKGFVLDMRNNPGGLLWTAIEITSYWVGGDDIIVIEKKRDGSFVAEKATNKNALLKSIPTIVLANKGSASGSEIVAGALQDYKYAKIVGETSFGKGSVQDLRMLKDGSSVKLTIAKWLTPGGREIDSKGIEPDIKVELTEEDWNSGKDPQLDKALEILKK